MSTTRHYARAPLAAAVASALLLAGCGGGGGGSASGGGSGTPTAISGKAADGYLVGATVCLDLNNNKQCDAGEPGGTTTAGGAYTLNLPAGTDPATYAVVVEVGADTIDEDTGTAVGKPYVLTAPPGKPEFVSPLTTAVHAIQEKNPALSVDEAAAVVKSQVGAGDGVSLFEDYVAAKQDDEAYDRLHKVAQVSGKVLAANQEAIEAAAADQGLTDASFAELLALAVQQVLDQLEQSAQAVDGAGDEFDIEKVSVDVADTTNLQDQLEEAEAVSGFATLSAQTLLAGGGHWIWGRAPEGDNPAEYEYGWVQAKTDQPGKLDEAWYIHDAATGWQLQSDDEAKLFLGTAGWQMASDTAPFFNVTYQTDGSARLALSSVDVAIKMTAAQLDVSGKPVKTYLQFDAHKPFAAAIVGEPIFSTGAKVYQVAFVVDQDQYSIDVWSDCGVYSVPDSDNCNLAWGYGSVSLETPAKSFAELIYPMEPTDVTNYVGLGDGVWIRVIADNRVQIQDQAAGGALSYGSWAYKTVHGKQLMMLTLPDRFRTRLWDDGQPFFAVQDGYIRRGAYLAKGTLEDAGEVWFNEEAVQDILTAFQEGVGVSDPGEPGDSGEPVAEVPPELVGSWYQAEANVVLSFLSNGHYMWAESGIEHGTVSWNATTGALTVGEILRDTNGTDGLSDVAASVVPSGDNLDFWEADTAGPIGGGEATFTRVTGEGITGSWLISGEGTLVVVTFLDGTYFVGESDDADIEGGQPGLERGTYTWDAETGAFTVNTVDYDSNGTWGLSDIVGIADAATATVSGSTLTFTEETEDGPDVTVLEALE